MTVILFLLTAMTQTPQVAVLVEGPAEALAADVAKAAGARTVNIEGISSLGAESLLVLPECRQFPAKGVPLVAAFLERGGHLLAVGGPPFETLLYPAEGDWQTREAMLAAVRPEHDLVDFSKVTLETAVHGTSHPSDAAKYQILKDGVYAVVELEHPIGWETIGFPCQPAPADHNVLVFRVAGKGETQSLLIELREKDGTRWMAVVPVTMDERPVGVHADDFEYWRDSLSQGRGAPEDRPRFDNLDRVVVGLALSHQPLGAGRYSFLVRRIATARLSGDFAAPPLPRLEGLCPPYKTFRASASMTNEVLEPLRGLELPLRPSDWLISPVARAMHASDTRGYVWQPLVKTGKDWYATPVSITWRSGGGTWTFCGVRPRASVTAELAKRLAAWIGDGPHPAPAQVPLLDADERGECVRVENGEFVLGGKRWFAHGINFWPLYTSGMEPLGYFSHWLHPDYYIPELIDMDLATLESLGVNLVSIQYGKTEEAPQLRDFVTRCGRHGIKVNLFISDAHPIYPAGDDDLSKRNYLELMRAANLEGNPHLFAYDLAWEPIVGRYESRKNLDHLWEEWILEQYDSLDHAEESWGFPANRREGKVTAPFDEQLATDGPHKVMVAAYRRFTDDLISRRYREVIRLARTVDDTHLFGARTGYGGTGTLAAVEPMQFQLTAGAAHLDFISPEGYGYGPANISDAAFVSQFARWAGNGKPVFWAEFGLSVWQGGPEQYRAQADLYQAFADMVLRTGANGWAGWWYPGGYRVDERSDYGIIGPDRAYRPAAEVLLRTAAALKAGAPLKREGALAVDIYAAPQGLAAAVQRHSKEFREAYEAGRLLEITGRAGNVTSADCPFIGVGGVPFEAPMPPEFLNAEIILQPEGEKGRLRVSVLNTGEATLSDDCMLRIEAAGKTTHVKLGTLGRFEESGRTIVDYRPPMTFTVVSKRFGEFGERRILTPE